MGEPTRDADHGGTDAHGRAAARWVVGGRTDCDHAPGDPVPLGLGGPFAYEACRRCDGIVVSRLGRAPEDKG